MLLCTENRSLDDRMQNAPDNASLEKAIAQSAEAICHLWKNLFANRPHFRAFISLCRSRRILSVFTHIATSERAMLMHFPHCRSYICACIYATRKYTRIYRTFRAKDKETFRPSYQSLSFFLFFSACPPALSALEYLARFLAPRRFVYFLYIRRFRSATFTLPCQAAVEVFCNPGKDMPGEKIDFTSARPFCRILKRT